MRKFSPSRTTHRERANRDTPHIFNTRNIRAASRITHRERGIEARADGDGWSCAELCIASERMERPAVEVGRQGLACHRTLSRMSK